MNKLNASGFLHAYEYQERDLKFILTAIYKCYLKILSSETQINNNENDIRDIFISDKYLDNYTLLQELDIVEFHFDKEIQTKLGRIDIRVLNMITKMKGKSKPYYYIECKRLDGVLNPNNKSTLNNQYITKGINRFIEEKYPTYNEANAMLGFIVKPSNIKENTTFFSELSHCPFIEGFEYSYSSTHKTKSNKNILLYHLMLDFSSRII